ncbi:ethanolamine utilization protein [uncultured Fusobacterium sp.]|uniref:ethanolamine utilization protein n=1 Tax=uncultured Fusobacterium sp. TaxID=159267 RepID=UPI000BBA85F2|nr:ethanolamine utilization protein [uncultured Fusobacterium sp.]BBA52869.1 ethanolamine utilization cobalamin adenosyltransferase [Fusobacterium varium]
MVLTEDKLKNLYRKEEFKKYVVENGTIMTPSARQFLADKGIEIVKEEAVEEKTAVQEKVIERVVEKAITPKYIGVAGESYFEKPEHMTQISGNILVKKNDVRIIFRGKLDSLQAKWLILQKEFENYGNEKLQKDMESVAVFIKKIVSAEVLDTEMEEIKVLEETLDKIKEISHNPKKFFGIGHLFDISIKNSILVLKLNEMRSSSREIEIAGVTAFSNEKGIIIKKEILKALNRLSSVIYVMMLKGEKGEYGDR